MTAFADQSSCAKASIVNSESSDDENAFNHHSSLNAPCTSQPSRHRRRNTLNILIHATMQLLTSPSTSPTSLEKPRASPSSITFAESSYISFPEYETYDYDEKIDDPLGSREEVEDMVIQMVKFDEMLVNGVRVPTTHPI
ncbi:3343_t:CDS:1 [Acaulospora colombiana]|uniref:3343_t:CDS:1 n=1 Tax=Acaulospora colombiana TaxID=27376 RepID=A0ACA9L0C0_9GLOM|nr:3343_t:CDS:1 [Acaulospora colombiana]